MAESNEATHFAMIAGLAAHVRLSPAGGGDGAIIVLTEGRAHLGALLASLDRLARLVHRLTQSQFSVDLFQHVLVDLVLLEDLVQVRLLILHLLRVADVALFVGLAQAVAGTC